MQFAASLTGGSFEESRMLKNVEACEWLTGAIRCLEVPNLDSSYVNMRAVSYLCYTLILVIIIFIDNFTVQYMFLLSCFANN